MSASSALNGIDTIGALPYGGLGDHAPGASAGTSPRTERLVSALMEMHWATVWESIADVIPHAPAVTNGDITRSWAEYDERAARVAAAFDAAGLTTDSKIGLYLYNGNEYLEAQYGAFKMRGVPVNVTTAISMRSCGTCSTTQMPKRWCSTRRWLTASLVSPIASPI